MTKQEEIQGTDLVGTFYHYYDVAQRHTKRQLLKMINANEFKNSTDGIGSNAHWREKVRIIRNLCGGK